jgi:hypothetical protein
MLGTDEHLSCKQFEMKVEAHERESERERLNVMVRSCRIFSKEVVH